MIEIRKYSGGFDYDQLDDADVTTIKDCATKYGIEADVYSTEIIITPYSGRDTNRIYVKFLYDIAPIIKNGEGEVECESFDTDTCGDITLEFFSIHDGRLFCQKGNIVREEIEPVIM